MRNVRRKLGYLLLAVLIAAGGSFLLREQNRPNIVTALQDGFTRLQGGQKFRITYPRKPERPSTTERSRVADGMPATVIDGDSLRVGHREIRLDGIDAPELRQTCRNADGREWACGRAAKARLAALVAGGNVACADKGRDRYGRTLAICSAGDFRDLGEVLVGEGLALNYDRYTARYHAVQERARSVRRGIWGGTFEHPEAWRRSHPRMADR